MRRIITIGLLILSLMAGTGCIRIAADITTGLPPPQRFFFGARSYSQVVPGVLAFMASGPHHEKLRAHEIPIFAVICAFAIVNAPLEVAVDILLLPVDGILYACYQASPPLDKYLYDNDLAGMRASLEKGADPNAVTPWFIESEPPIYTAYINGQEDFFNLLLEYGASPTFKMLMAHDLSKHATKKVAMLRKAFKNGCCSPPRQGRWISVRKIATRPRLVFD